MAVVLAGPHAGTNAHALKEDGNGSAHRQQDGSGVAAPLHRETGRFSAPAARVGSPRRNSIHAPFYHLPAPVTVLIGREHEQEAICTLLRRSAVHLVSLTGTGGVGKTLCWLLETSVLNQDEFALDFLPPFPDLRHFREEEIQ